MRTVRSRSVGTDAYKEYMTAFVAAHPDQMPSEMKQVPEVDVNEIPDHPNLAGITYSRQQCQRCHVGVNGREKRGDFRGAGCSSCHVPYSNDGFYEGGDPTISKDQPGKLLVHRMQATRKSKVQVGDIDLFRHSVGDLQLLPQPRQADRRQLSGHHGVPLRLALFTATGGKQPKLHTKNYLFIKDDLHHQVQSRPGNPEGGMLCQDCHTTVDMHGDGNLPGTTLAQVEIECEDCHGTVSPSSPGNCRSATARSTARISAIRRAGWPTTSPPSSISPGLRARGRLPADGPRQPLRQRRQEGQEGHPALGLRPRLRGAGPEADRARRHLEEPERPVAMGSVGKHMESMECYACHADWAPQCYGCHITVDYSKARPTSTGSPMPTPAATTA